MKKCWLQLAIYIYIYYTYLAHILCFLGVSLETSLYVFNDRTFSGFFFVSMIFFQIQHKIKTYHNLITIQKGLSLYHNVLVTCNVKQIIECASQQGQIYIRLSPFIISSSSFCTFKLKKLLGSFKVGAPKKNVSYNFFCKGQFFIFIMFNINYNYGVLLCYYN